MATRDGKKSGGRQKGTPNKNKSELQKKADALGVDPFEILLLFTKGDWQALGYPQEKETKFNAQGGVVQVRVISPDLRVAAAKAASEYLYPKKKAVEIVNGGEGESSAPLQVIILPSNGREKN